MKAVLVMLAVLLLVAVVRADSMDQAEAKNRGITVEQVQLERDLKRAQARIAQLEKDLAEARAGILPTLTSANIFSLTVELKSMPSELQPTFGEAEKVSEARLVWLKDHFQGKRVRVEFEISSVKISKDNTTIITSGLDDSMDYHATCEIKVLTQKLNPKDHVVLEGSVNGIDISGGLFGNEKGEIVLSMCKVISVASKN